MVKLTLWEETEDEENRFSVKSGFCAFSYSLLTILANLVVPYTMLMASLDLMKTCL